MTSTDRSPKRQQIREHLLDLIESLSPGAPVPSERQLCEELGVSRPTVRAAVDGLVRDGLLVRRHGSGMFVAEPKIAQELGKSPGRVDGVWTSRTLDLVRFDAGARLGRRMRLTPAAQVVCITRLRLADGEPISIDTVHVPDELVPGLTARDLEKHSFYQLLAARYGIEVDEAVQSIEPTVTGEEESDLLGVPLYFPALLLERTTEDASGRIVEYTRAVYRGDRYRITTRLKLSGGRRGGLWDATANIPGADTVTTDPYFSKS
ncbi:GntR family transcriptional regulator [Streptomyces sp. NPDC090025]|uniref:GntR family transcriptional regulator n=1 Tax=Streptomyces sp. NPDC090025 TaxID=3365922 RepID=UPI0038375E24